MITQAARAALLGLVLAPAACTTMQFECVPVIDYSAEQQAAAARQLATLPPDSPVAMLVTDYGKQRKAERACAGATS